MKKAAPKSNINIQISGDQIQTNFEIVIRRSKIMRSKKRASPREIDLKTPFGIIISLFLTFTTADLKSNFLGVDRPVLAFIIVCLFAVCFIWLIIGLFQILLGEDRPKR